MSDNKKHVNSNLSSKEQLNGCTLLKCKYYYNKRCNDPNEYVNQNGESVCGKQSDAILLEDYNNSVYIYDCPFCGSKCSIDSTTFGDDSTIYYKVRCNDNFHALDSWEESDLFAIIEWNKRKCK